MKRSFLVTLFGLVIAVSCEKKNRDVAPESVENETGAKAKKEFKMYEMSEMAALMEQMYADNMGLKNRIIIGDTIGSFPQHFLNIHASAMTDESDNDAIFKEEAAKFLKAQQLIYSDTINAKKHFNEAVSSCVKCHEQKCEGPIPRIKKLYIK